MEPFEKKIQDYTKTVQERCVRESAVMETVRKSTDAFVLQEERTLTYAEFLYQQFRYIQKRWWVLQGVVLAFLLFILKDYVNAVKYSRMALKCTERAYGVDSIEAAICHSQLSDALGRAGGLNESILHYKACLDIYVMVCGDRSEEIGEVYANLGLLYKELVFNEKAVECLRIAEGKLTKRHPLYLRCVQGLAQCSA